MASLIRPSSLNRIFHSPNVRTERAVSPGNTVDLHDIHELIFIFAVSLVLGQKGHSLSSIDSITVSSSLGTRIPALIAGSLHTLHPSINIHMQSWPHALGKFHIFRTVLRNVLTSECLQYMIWVPTQCICVDLFKPPFHPFDFRGVAFSFGQAKHVTTWSLGRLKAAWLCRTTDSIYLLRNFGLCAH